MFCQDILSVSLTLGQRFSGVRITWGTSPSPEIWTLWVFAPQGVVSMTTLLAWFRGLLEMHSLKPQSWRHQDLSLPRFSGDLYAYCSWERWLLVHNVWILNRLPRWFWWRWPMVRWFFIKHCPRTWDQNAIHLKHDYKQLEKPRGHRVKTT